MNKPSYRYLSFRMLRHAAVLPLLVATMALAASSFNPQDQPFGHIAPPALSDGKLTDGVVAFVPWFDYSDYTGDLLAADVTASGRVNYSTPLWRASEILNTGNDADDAYWDTSRFIVTVDSTGNVVPFRKSELDGDTLDLLKPDEDKRVRFLRGERNEEGGRFGRVRGGILGDIIHSNPVYVGAPSAPYAFSGYVAYARNNASRPGRVYVGANDGMLHAFNAATGEEAFAYVPSMVMTNLPRLADSPYSHTYFVDGPQVAEDAFFNGGWHTVVVGGLGGGGKGIYAIDATSAAPIVDESNTATGAGSRVLWEFSSLSFGGGNLGYTYARPSVVRMNSGDFAVVVGNGYESTTGRASLFVLDITDGSVIREIVVFDSDANGLSSPTVVDIDGDTKVDYAYAGDLNGNLWKFDLTSSSSGSWSVAYSGDPLFQTDAIDGVRQPISSAPDVGFHPVRGLMVYFGTGRLMSYADAEDTSPQAVYGIRDHDWTSTDTPIDSTRLLAQTLVQTTHPASGLSVRTATSYEPNWSLHKGWVTSLVAVGAPAYAQGERVVQDVTLRSGRVQFLSSNPTFAGGENWLMQLDAATGGAPDRIVMDVDRSGVFDLDDNVDGDGNGAVEETAADRVVGQYKDFGLASRPVYGQVDDYGDAILVNQMATVSQTQPGDPGTPDGDPAPGDGDYGLIGGHMDLDVSSQTYPIEGGTTDDHTHEWDDKYGSVVNFMAIQGATHRSVPDTGAEPGDVRTKPFIITVANAHLSPGGVLEINGVSWPVLEYRALVKRFLAGNLDADETFPRYILDEPTAGQAAAGIVQLKSFSMGFSANAILAGGLIGTNTGCVKGNETAPNGEYRNGALTTQLLDASNLGAGFQFNNAADAWEVPGGGSTRIQRLGHALPAYGIHEVGDGMMWESTLFWHWDGICYSAGDEADYVLDFEDLVGQPWDPLSDDDVSEQGSPDPDPNASDGTTGQDPVPEFTADASTAPEVSDTLTSAGDRLGRLFWRELIPDNN